MTEPTKYTVQAYVAGLSWVTFAVTRDGNEAERLEHRASTADDSLYPGTAPRRTQILVDGVPAAEKSKPTLSELFP